jgi:hypothetical protein
MGGGPFMGGPRPPPGVPLPRYMCRVGQNQTFIDIYGVRTVPLAGKSPYIRHIRCRYTVLANPIYVCVLE